MSASEKLFYDDTAKIFTADFAQQTGAKADNAFGQQRVRSAIVDHLSSNHRGGAVGLLVAPFGAGKTTVREMVMSELIGKGIYAADQLQTAVLSTVPRVLPNVNTEVLWVEEADVRPGFNSLSAGIGHAARLLDHGLEHLILAGDNALLSTRLMEMYFGPVAKIPQFALDPLTPELFQQIFRWRAEIALGSKRVEEINWDKVFDPTLLNLLLPNTKPAVGTFRTALITLKRMAGHYEQMTLHDAQRRYAERYEHHPVVFDGQQYAETSRSKTKVPDHLHGEKRQFLEEYQRLVLERLHRAGQLYPMDAKSLWGRCIESDTPFDQFKDKTLDPLAGTSLMVPVGIPFESHPSDKYPEPYLPSPEFLLQGYFLKG